MKKSMLLMRQSILLLLLASFSVTVIALVGTAPPTFTIAQADPMTTVYLEIKEAIMGYNYISGSDPNNTWNNETNAWDQTDDTYANRTSNAAEDNEDNRIEGTGNTAPGTGATITQVEIGVEQFCTNTSVITKVKSRPVFGGADLGDVHEINSRASDTDSTDYVDITSDTNAPSPWTWSDVQNLDVRAWGKWENPEHTETLCIDQIRVRVTYLPPPAPTPTINGTVIDETFTVNLMIRDAYQVRVWQAGLTFNATALECLEFKQGEFLSDVGSTLWKSGTINNTAGVITPHGAGLYGLQNNATGDGRLGYLTFKVKALGVSDLHLHDVKVIWKISTEVPINIIDVYTVVLDTTAPTVVTVSNSTGGFYDHAFSTLYKQLSFKVVTEYIMGLREAGFSNVTIPKTLLWIENLDRWRVILNGTLLSTEERTITENASHTSIYFTYTAGIYEVQITTRSSSAISIAFSSALITLGSDVTISGNITAFDPINPLRPNVNVTIQSRPIGAVTWEIIDTVETDSNSNYTYTWTPETGGTHEVMTSWKGDNETIGAKSDVLAPIVFYVFEPEGVYIETNSTVAEFNSIPALNFSQSLKQISFNVTSPYGTKGYSNVTIPIDLLPPPEPEIRWKVMINYSEPLSAEEIIIAENASHTSLYFTYNTGINIVEITTRMGSNISLALSLDSIDLGSSVTINGNITLEDDTMRANANVTIHIYRSVYQPIDGTWSGLAMTETDENGNYTYPWEPKKAGIHEVTASWEGDENAIRGKSDVLSLTVIQSSTISIDLSSANITFGSSLTISGSIDPVKPDVSVYAQYRLIDEVSWHTAEWNLTDQDSSYTLTWTPDTPGTYDVRATWLGDEITYNATSNVLTLTAKWTSIISFALSSTEITKGKSVTISGNITVADNIARSNVTVTILYRLSGGVDWTTLDTVETDENGNYTYSWKPEETGTYEVMASWEGDDITFGNESEVKTLEVKGAAFPLIYVVAAVVAIIIIAAIAVYFVRFRKPR